MMISGFRCICTVVILVGCLRPMAAPAQERMGEDAKAVIQALIDKANLAWNAEKGASSLAEILSDQSFGVVFPRSDDHSVAMVLNKQTFCEWFEKLLQERRLRKRQHRIKSITVRGPIAYEIGETHTVTAEGVERQFEILNFFAKDETGWKLVFSAPADQVRKALESDSANEETVRELAQAFVATFRAKNPTPFKRFEGMLTNDVIAIMSDGRLVEGKQALVEFYREQLAQMRESFRTWSTSYKIKSVRLLGDGATVFGQVFITARFKEDKEPISREVWETLVFRKSAGSWHLIEEHSTQAAPNVPATP